MSASANKKMQKNLIAEHDSQNEIHTMQFRDPIVLQSTSHFYTRLHREAIDILNMPKRKISN